MCCESKRKSEGVCICGDFDSFDPTAVQYSSRIHISYISKTDFLSPGSYLLEQVANKYMTAIISENGKWELA